MMEKITIIGGGSWGTAIAQLFANNGHEVLIYVRDEVCLRKILTN